MYALILKRKYKKQKKKKNRKCSSVVRTSLDKAQTQELLKYRYPSSLTKVMRRKEPIPHWRKKFETSTLEFGIVIDQQLYKNMAVWS